MSTPEVSHGRGGAGNITPDNTTYVEGEIVRQGTPGSHHDGAFSTGRGGAANIGDAGAPAPPTGRADREVVPEAAVRPSMEDEDFHTGRGGAGNEHVSMDRVRDGKEGKKPETDGGAVAEKVAPRGLADRLKHKLFGVFHHHK